VTPKVLNLESIIAASPARCRLKNHDDMAELGFKLDKIFAFVILKYLALVLLATGCVEGWDPRAAVHGQAGDCRPSSRHLCDIESSRQGLWGPF